MGLIGLSMGLKDRLLGMAFVEGLELYFQVPNVFLIQKYERRRKPCVNPSSYAKVMEV